MSEINIQLIPIIVQTVIMLQEEKIPFYATWGRTMKKEDSNVIHVKNHSH